MGQRVQLQVYLCPRERLFTLYLFTLCLSEDNNSKSEKYWAGLFFPRMPFPIHDLISLRMASWMRSKFCQSHSNMAAGTAVMHFPSPRSTVKKEEPARRVHKIKADEVIIDTFGQRANCRAIFR